jgi:CheY-like chemotaxis protein
MATILVVDDKPLNPSLLTTLLGSGGHHLVEASNGFEAIGKALAEPPDFDDHRHPHARNGRLSTRNANQLKLMIDDLLEASRTETSKLTIRRYQVEGSTQASRKVLGLGLYIFKELHCSYREKSRGQSRTFVRGGAYDFFQKPVSEEWLMESIKRALALTAPKDTSLI